MRWVLRILGGVVVLVLLAVGALFVIPKDRIAALAADQVKAQTGRDLTIAAGLSVTLWPVLGVSTGAVTLANADWAGPEPMLRAESASVGVDAAALLGGEVRIRAIEIRGPELRLATRADGTGNWEFAPAGDAAVAEAVDNGAAPATGSAVPPLTLERLEISDARVIYAAAGAAPVDLRDVRLRLDWAEATGAAEIDGAVTLAGTPVSLRATVADFAGFLGGTVSGLALDLAAEGGGAGFDGRAGLAGEADGALRFETQDTAAFLAALGVPGVALPRGLGQAVDMTGDLTVTSAAQVALRNAQLTLDQNSLTVDMDADLGGARPMITARVAGGALDLSALSEGEAGSDGASAAEPEGWSRAPIDASALGLADADVRLTADSLDLGLLTLGASDVGVTVDNARAVVALTRVAAYGGVLSGEVVANNRSGFSTGGTVRAADVALEPLLTDLAGISRLAGAAQADLQFLASGGSVHALMNSLSGTGSLDMGRGTISGIDLDRLMRSGDVGGGTTVFDSLTASWVMEAGQMRNEDLALLLSNYRAEGAGRVGLGPQDIDYTFTPIALRANSGQGVAIPVRISGPWAAPRILPDLSQALQLDLDGKVDEVRQDAEQALDQKLREELDVAPDSTQSLEDAAKDKLKEEAGNALRGLLGD